MVNLSSRELNSTPIRIELNAITSRIGFSYAREGWHPFVQTLKEYEANPTLEYKDSTLSKLYNNFKPSNVQEVLLDHIKTPLAPFCDWPPRNELIRRVWALEDPIIKSPSQNLKKKMPNKGWIFFGPHKEEYGEKEFQRLIAVYDSIKSKGYLPCTSNEPVDGYFLKKGEEYRFVLLQGNHRVSALKVLGYSQIEVIIRKGHPSVIDKTELKKWTKDFGGIYSFKLVSQLFESLFHESGLSKARRYDLCEEKKES